MNSEKIYPISEKKLLDLRNQGQVPHSKLAARIFTFGVIIVSFELFKSRIRRVWLPFTGPIEDQYFDNLSVEVVEGTTLLILLSLLILISYFIFSLIETKFLRLPLGNYPKGIRKLKNPISIKIELFLGLLVAPVFLFYLVLQKGDYSLIEKIQDHLNKEVLLYGCACIWTSVICSILNKLKFRLEQRMSKEEIIKESLEGQMSPATRSLISKASTEL